MQVDSNTLVALLSLFATCGGFLYTWFREARMHRWRMQDAKARADKVAADAAALAAKTASDAAMLAANINSNASAVATKVIADAEAIATRVRAAAEQLARKVEMSTNVSSVAAAHAQTAYSEANRINTKIADLNAQLVAISSRRADRETQFTSIIDERLAKLHKTMSAHDDWERAHASNDDSKIR